MAARIALADYATWFDHEVSLKAVRALPKPYPATQMAVSEANPLVNSPRNEGPRLLDPAAGPLK
jgi:putative SOS response-associated peptidase YedK